MLTPQNKNAKAEKGSMTFDDHRDLASVLKTKKMKRFQMELPEELHGEFKAACAKEGTTMTSVITDMVKAWLKQRA